MRILIYGGRDYHDITQMDQIYLDLIEEFDEFEVICGMAKGADKLSFETAIRYGNVVHCYPARWFQYGKTAGIMRNQQMLEEGRPDLGVAFPGGRGTAHMTSILKKAGIPVREIT